ncbi:hypothetical protein CMQ_6249 [Grosmannia clavigera kw1407]|uniref:Transmembrane protein n=1 Tax=Grosmannia clavigera (strain kw1407 / UAMH 11150) TaxID=655863 RepID=F0XMN4_GROCL|nr:uncharacterized protein CMQ_6249 [Grosmannia clavigera kw1407]EFX01307.1 hypothetical protein CMQ_6249 [Grosmannia clavigera kw1407]
MPEFFSFTLGAETNPRVLRGPDEESPLLVGRQTADEQEGEQEEDEQGEEPDELDELDKQERAAGMAATHTSPMPDGIRAGRHAGHSAGRLQGDRSDRSVNTSEDGHTGPFRRRGGPVHRVMGRWWTRWALLVVLPAVVAVTWCAVPMPQWALADGENGGLGRNGEPKRPPGHGEARVRIGFWHFLLAYYGPYNGVALVWITKVFNLYGLNWWADSLGFVASAVLLAAASLAAPALFFVAAPQTARRLLSHNTVWVTWTFAVMAVPAAAALALLLLHERHLGLRHALSATQRIFTTARWAGEPDGHFVRFLWLVSALFISLLVFELGEASASLFLSALPAMRHETVYAVVYVWGWTVTVFLLDLLTAWILGGHQGERVGSYPLGWVFKLYFMLTYQTYVRALYARLRSPSQVIMLQVLSSSTLIVLTPVLMSPWTHRLLVALGLNGLAYGAYQKVCARNVFVRFVAENATMLAFLGALLVLHFGPNRDVYPYFGFDDEPVNATANALGSLLDRFASQTYGYTPSLPDYPVPPPPAYTFSFTLYAATITWACELVAAVLVSSLILCFYGIAVVAEAKADLAAWPELLPASVAVTVHVLQNMLFSIIRLRF